MIEVTPLSLIVLALASAVAGAFLHDRVLRVCAKFGVRVTFDPGCKGCGKKSACYVNDEAECLDCLVESSEARLAESDLAMEKLNEALLRDGAMLKKLDESVAESQAKMKKIDALLNISPKDTPERPPP
jgi:hypothetical protein